MSSIPALAPLSAASMLKHLGGPVHFVGICGKGMSSLAVALHRAGVPVTGSDEPIAYGEPVALLRAEGIPYHPEFNASHLEGASKVVISRQYSRGNPEVEAVLDTQLPYYSLPQFILEHFLHGQRNIVVAGTKGKTTTTTMLTWILEQEGRSPGYLIGGVPKNELLPGRFPGSGINVIEGDDYETLFWDHSPKFVYYRPSAVILTNVYADHPEYHADDDSSLAHFRSLICQLPANGILLTGCASPLTQRATATVPCPVHHVGFEETSDSCLTGWSQSGGHSRFTLHGIDFELPITGRYNALNAALAALAAQHHGVPLERSAAHLSTFLGVHGRQDLVGSSGGVDLYRDLAYLPECLGMLHENFRLRFPNRRLVLLYQPFIVNGMPGKEAEITAAMRHFDLVLLADVFKPILCAAVNPEFSDTVQGLLAAHEVPVQRVGTVDAWPQTAVPWLEPGDVVVAIAHPKVQHLFDDVVTALSR